MPQRACLLSNKSNAHPFILYHWKQVHNFYFQFSVEHTGKRYSKTTCNSSEWRNSEIRIRICYCILKEARTSGKTLYPNQEHFQVLSRVEPATFAPNSHRIISRTWLLNPLVTFENKTWTLIITLQSQSQNRKSTVSFSKQIVAFDWKCDT